MGKKEKITKEELDQARTRLYMVMLQHIGPDKKIGMGELFERVFQRQWNHRINDTRMVRMLVREMQREGQSVMSSSSSTNGGYWVAASSSELNGYADKLKKRALEILARAANMKKTSLPDYIGQMRLELEARNDS